ncbi:MAG: zf-HC2 domain-containing protein, partial [bacterium]
DKCDFNSVFIEQFVDNELSYEESAEIAAHIKSCDSCRKKEREYFRMKQILKDTFENEVLCEDEKNIFREIIEKEKTSFFSTLLQKLKNVFSAHEFAVGVAGLLIVSLLSVFLYRVHVVDSEEKKSLKQIMALHNHELPGEFSGKDNLDMIISENLKLNSKLKQIIDSENVKVDGRFVNIGATPAASVRIRNKKGFTTLFLSGKNNEIGRLFKDSECSSLVGCSARVKRSGGRKIVYIQKKDRDYLLVGEDEEMSSQLVRRISND